MSERFLAVDVVLISYLGRPIFDVCLNHVDIGVAGPWPYSGRGTMTGVQVPLGDQRVSWRLDGAKGAERNGETVVSRNSPKLEGVSGRGSFLAMHIYADDTVELALSGHFPDISERGAAFDLQWRRQHGR